MVGGTLHAAILAGDVRVAPLAVEQPVASDAAPRGDVAGTFRRVRTGPALLAFALAVVDAFLGLPVGIVLLVAPGSRLQVAGVATLTATGGLLIALVALGFWLRRRMRVHVHEGDVWWRAVSGRKVRLDWQRARAFYRVHYREGSSHSLRLAYYLDAGATILAWRAQGPAEQANAERLVGLIAARTALPVRDTSVEAQRIALDTERPSTSRRARERQVPAAGQEPGANKQTDARLPRWAWMTPLVLVGTFVLTALGAQILEPRYYANLYAQAHAHAPLYTDSLSSAESGWPTYAHATFAGGVYQLTYDDTSGTVFALAPRSFGDGLYEVSVRIDAGGQYSGAGLAACCRLPADDLIAFEETPRGEWWQVPISVTSRWDVSYRDAHLGDSTAIHRGLGVWNRVAVLVQGAQLTYFVNGQYVAGTTMDAPPTRVGIYLEATTDGASFRDFAVYPAA